MNALTVIPDSLYNHYLAEGQLDHERVVVSRNKTGQKVVVNTGLNSLVLTASAALELANHLMAAAVSGDEQEASA